jgi:hypothetical protein
MKLPHALCLTSCAILASFMLSGCGPATGTAAGEVTYNGAAVETGYVNFTPVDGKGTGGAGAVSAGRYRADSLTPGTYLVQVFGVKKVSFASTSAEMKRRAQAAREGGNYDGLLEPADTIPENAEGNNVKIDIKAGQNEIDFHIGKGAK